MKMTAQQLRKQSLPGEHHDGGPGGQTLPKSL